MANQNTWIWILKEAELELEETVSAISVFASDCLRPWSSFLDPQLSQLLCMFGLATFEGPRLYKIVTLLKKNTKVRDSRIKNNNSDTLVVLLYVVQLNVILTHTLLFAQLYWLLYVTWYKTTEQLSRKIPHFDICPLIIFVEKKQSQLNGLAFSCLLFLHGRKTNSLFLGFTGSNIKKIISNASPESTRNGTKSLLSTRDTIINGRVIK